MLKREREGRKGAAKIKIVFLKLNCKFLRISEKVYSIYQHRIIFLSLKFSLPCNDKSTKFISHSVGRD